MPWGKKLDVKRADNGVWSVVVPEVKDGVYRYSFVVDGVKVYDPASPTAGETSALAFVGNENVFYAMKKVPHGAVAQRYYESKNLKTTRRLHVWTPAGYEQSTDKLPVLYLRSEEHTSELQSRQYLVCRLLLEKNNITERIVLICISCQ